MGAEIAIKQKQYLLKKVSKEGQRTFDKQHVAKIRRNDRIAVAQPKRSSDQKMSLML